MTYQIDFEPIGRRVPCGAGATILEVAQGVGISLTSICGSQTTCGRCRVRVLSGRVSPVSDNERARLSEEEIAAGFRLACATHVLGNLKLDIPPTSLTTVQRLQLFGQEPELAPDPVVSVYELKLPEPSLNDAVADWENLNRSLKERHGLDNLRPDFFLLQDLPLVLRVCHWEVAATVRGDEVIDVRPQGSELLGMAFDLGTTKIAAYLVNLRTGETLAAQGVMNPQIAYGEDVMSRISCAIEGGSNELRESILETLNRLIREVGGNPEEVVEVTIVGNTAMHHLILGLPVKQLGRVPYLPAVRRSLDIKAYDLGLHVAPGAYVHFLPNIAGFVGADHVAMLLATGIHETDKTVIGIDIGTNTEVALATKGIITSLSCASGPAFEGAGIRYGMRATSGAIKKVEIGDDGVHLEVIGDAPPTGICGSGILDAISELRRWQIIDSRGRLQDHPLVRRGADGREFVLATGNTTGTGQDIVVTQRDIGEVQLAKAAIRSGISVLLGEAGIREDEIDEVIITGAFGSYLDVNSALGIGLFSPLPLDRFKQVGNAAGVGAKLALISKRRRVIAEEIASRIRYIELAVHPKFKHEFSQALRLP